MAYIYAGTAYNQVVTFAPACKSKHKTLYGPMSRQMVNHITLNFDQNSVYYSTPKHINMILESGETSRVASSEKDQKIIYIDYDHEFSNLRYGLSNGGVRAVGNKQDESNSEPIVLFKGDGPNQYVGVQETENKEQYLFYGKGIVPYIANLPNGLVSWRGKNVKHDELDLEVPIDDVDAAFIRDQKFHAILNATNKLRIYDIRGTNRRPCSDILLKTTQKAKMTRMLISNCKNYYYFSNDIGQIFQCDSRKDWNIAGKFKGITTTVTDMAISEKELVTSSLDSYVRIFSLDQKKEVSKFYMNKPIYSLFVLFSEEEEQKPKEEFNEEEIDLAEEEAELKPASKIKQIRKRNKVGLKYLQPREFDDVQIKQEDVKKEEWYEQLNPIDRREFEEQI